MIQTPRAEQPWLTWAPNPGLPISLPGQPGCDRCQLLFVCSKPSLPDPWLHPQGLVLHRGLCWEGKGRQGSSLQGKGQLQTCSTLCLAGKEVIYKLTQLLESHSTGEGEGWRCSIPADGAGGGHQEPGKCSSTLGGQKEARSPPCLDASAPCL